MGLDVKQSGMNWRHKMRSKIIIGLKDAVRRFRKLQAERLIKGQSIVDFNKARERNDETKQTKNTA